MPSRVFLLFLCCSVLAGGASAQSHFFRDDQRTFYGGIVGGMNICQVDGDGYGGYHKAGLNVGACVYAQFTPAMGASMELLYAQKGARDVNETYSPYVGQYFAGYYLDLNYVEVPVMFNFFTNHKLHASIGGSYSRLLKSKEDLTIDHGYAIDQDKYYFNKNEFSYLAGLTYQLYKGLFINARYQYSINTIRPAERAIVGWGIDERNHLINLRLILLMGSAKDGE